MTPVGAPRNLLDHDIFGTDAPADADRWVFHYTTLDTASAIASGGTLWLGRLATMNDPREYKAVEAVTLTVTAAGRRLPPGDVRRAIQELVAARLNVAAASFSADRAEGAPGTATRAEGRGYARPSLWAHYGGLHKGVCLIFDRVAVEHQLIAQYGADAFVSAVSYRRGFDSGDWSGILEVDEVARLGVDAAVDRHLRTYVGELLFTKSADWEPEREWRCSVVGQPSGPTVELQLTAGTVAGVVVGLDVSEGDLEKVRDVALRFGVDANVARTYLHQMNLIDVLPIDTSGPSWRYYTDAELQALGYL